MNKNPEIFLPKILKAIHGIKYGEVIIKIQDSRVIQIDRLEKFRVGKADPHKEGTSNNITLSDQITGG